MFYCRGCAQSTRGWRNAGWPVLYWCPACYDVIREPDNHYEVGVRFEASEEGCRCSDCDDHFHSWFAGNSSDLTWCLTCYNRRRRYFRDHLYEEKTDSEEEEEEEEKQEEEEEDKEEERVHPVGSVNNPIMVD